MGKTTATAKSTTTPKPKGTPAKPASPVEDDDPVGPSYMDDDEDDDTDAAAPVARNVGSLLGGSAAAKPAKPVPASARPVETMTAPEPTPSGTQAARPHAAKVYWEQAKQLGPAHTTAVLLRKAAEKLAKHRDVVAKWGDGEHVALARARLADALVALNDSAKSLQELPVGWTPPTSSSGGKGAPKTLPAGAQVAIRENVRKEYEGALEPAEMDALFVVKHEEGKPKVVCRTKDGARAIVSRGHLTVVNPNPAPAGAAPDAAAENG